MVEKMVKEQSVEAAEAEARRFGASPEQARVAHGLVRKRRFPSAVRTFELRFGEDSTGSPAMRIVFLVDNDLMPSAQKIDELNDFAQQVRSDLVQQHFPFWPYVEFRAIR